MTHEETIRIGEVTERTELSSRTLRHYDEIGLVTPSARTEGGFRLYTGADIARILLIRRMKPLGFTLDEMRELLDVVDALEASPDDVDLRKRLDAIRDDTAERREKLSRQVAMADEFMERLSQV